ncbi:MAG: MCP four helix bundle domain-containing protein [Bacteroidales bacterium]|nr:MCP four helix bundle domain-containing protein [Bacteroidales bacterium]
MNKKSQKHTKKHISIGRKVSLGFAVLAVILFFSSVISVFEFVRMNKALSGAIGDNVASVNIARSLSILTEDYNFKMLDIISFPDDSVAKAAALEQFNSPRDNFNGEFSATMEDLRKSFTTRTEHTCADSVLLAYTAYMQVLQESHTVSQADLESRKDWYFNRLQPFYHKLVHYIDNLAKVSQDALMRNSRRIDDTFYRSIMPAIASVIVGLVIVLLFNYYINYYLISPLQRIKRGISDYRLFRRNYNVETGDTGDELDELNASVRELIEDHRTATKNRF